jgi:hypothetical protein
LQYNLPSLSLEKGTCLALEQCSGGPIGFCLPFRKHLRSNHASYGRKHMQNKVYFRKSIKLCDQIMDYTSSARWILHFTGKNSNFSRISWADFIQPGVQKNHRRTRTDTISQHNYCNCQDHYQRITSNPSSHIGKCTIWILKIPSFIPFCYTDIVIMVIQASVSCISLVVRTWIARVLMKATEQWLFTGSN